ncbi:helix-turn-helix transcriptional regulator [Adlercreutzia equolifaciens]|uniref:helix-turn-helix transcriptional regulator n=1 Tax=Adlercreutzia equolifaciens TaxID=446660 RepID=UPI0023AFB400|nr:helix-turn-helix transcriptional regulator [Adlercreutzia equolifaciens]MDE8702500.1 helix-turn-helix transcriptional regulator [Adlercreutzia equolifaciens]
MSDANACRERGSMSKGIPGEAEGTRGLGNLALAAGGFGLLLAALTAVVHRSGILVFAEGLSEWKPFVMGFFAGCLMLGGALLLFYVREEYAQDMAFRALLRRMVGTCGLVLAIIGLLCPLPLLLRGFASGFGMGLLLYPWLSWFSARTMSDRLMCLGLSFAVAALASAAMYFAPGAFALGSVCILLLCTWAAVAALPFKAAPILEISACEEGVTTQSRLASFASGVWRPCIGALITLFVFGLTWDTDTVPAALNGGIFLAFEKVYGMVAAAAVLLLLSRFAHRGHDAQRVLFNIVLPLMVLVFVVRPYFLGHEPSALTLTLFGFFRETGFALFLGAAWVAVADAARESNVSLGVGAGLLFAGAGIAELAGMGAFYLLGDVAFYAGAILFTLYLIVIAITNGPVIDGGALLVRDEATAAEVFEAAAVQRCEALAEAWSLTPREREVLALLGRGHSYPYIAKELVVSENTVRTHVRNVYKKARIGSREELIAVIHQTGE